MLFLLTCWFSTLTPVFKDSPCSYIWQRLQSSARCSSQRCFVWHKQKGFFLWIRRLDFFLLKISSFSWKSGRSGNNPVEPHGTLGSPGLHHTWWTNAPHRPACRPVYFLTSHIQCQVSAEVIIKTFSRALLGSVVKKSACQYRRHGSHLWSRKISHAMWITTKPMSHNLIACALEPRSRNYWSLHALEPVLCNKRSPWNEKPTHDN